MQKDKFFINNNKLLSFLLNIIDFLIPILFLRSKKNNDLKLLKNKKIKINKILISNIAHLGDVILSTSVLKILKKEFPNAKIYFLCGSWSYEIIKDHPHIQKIFIFDHYKLNRSSISFLSKLISHLRTRYSSISSIKKENITIGIDLRLHFPNSSYILYKGQIPFRFGFSSGGFSKLFTNSLDYKQKNEHITRNYIDLLNLFFKNKILENQLSNDLYINNLEFNQNNNLFTDLPENYYIIHIGSGLKSKMLDIKKWVELKDILVSKKINLFFTGFGKIENEIINDIILSSPYCINLCDKLSFNDFLFFVKNAKKVISVDTSIIHIATSFDIPLIIFYSKINNHHNWVLKKKNIKIIEFQPGYCDMINLNEIHL